MTETTKTVYYKQDDQDALVVEVFSIWKETGNTFLLLLRETLIRTVRMAIKEQYTS